MTDHTVIIDRLADTVTIITSTNEKVRYRFTRDGGDQFERTLFIWKGNPPEWQEVNTVPVTVEKVRYDGNQLLNVALHFEELQRECIK